MAIRYDAVGGMAQSPDGRYMTYAEHEEMVRQLLETIDEFLGFVEKGKFSAAEAKAAIRAALQTHEIEPAEPGIATTR